MKTQQQTTAIVLEMTPAFQGYEAFWSIEARHNPDCDIGVCTE